LVEVITKGTTPTTLKRAFVASGINFVKAESIDDDGQVVPDKLARVDEETHHLLARSQLQVGDVLFSIAGVIGRTAMVPSSLVPANTNQALAIIRPNADVVNGRFLYYYLRSKIFRDYSLGRVVQTAQANVSLGELRAAPVSVPLLRAQHKIAAILSAYDDLIANNNRRIKLLEEIAQRIYREWFVDFRYPGHETVPLVDSELGMIPRGWVVVPLSAVCERITDGAHLSPVTTEVGKPMASVKDMTPRRLDLDSCRRIGVEAFEVLVRQDCRPRANDVLVAKDGSYLKHVFVVRDADDVVILSSIALLRPSGAIRPDVLALCLQQSETKDRLKGFVSGVAIPRIVLKDFRIFPVVRPPDGLQADLVERVVPLLSLALALDKASTTLRTTRDLLLPRLISGEIDVEDLDILTASVAA